MAREKILVVDDEAEISELIRMYLVKEGFQVILTSTGEQAYEMASHESPDLIILDILLPGQDGIETCTQLRRLMDVPILFLSCKDQDLDKILGLSVGGDDYITKPFSPSVLVARVKAHLRRSHISSETKNKKQSLIYPGLEINLSSRSVLVNHSPVTLTAKEFNLLVFLAQNPNRVFYTSQIFEKIWDNYSFEKDARTVMVHISNLRKKIEQDHTKPKYIITVRGVGYKFSGLTATIKKNSVCENCSLYH